MNVGMKTGPYADDWLRFGSTLTNSRKLIGPGECQAAGVGEAEPSIETELAISLARLREKQELDARFAEIIAMIHETRRKS
jgi:hypothetical protein